MNFSIYLYVLGFFILGGALNLLVGKKLESRSVKQNWLKYATYFIIANLLFLSVVFDAIYFFFLSVLIVSMSYFEIVRLTYCSGKYKIGMFAIAFFTLFFLAFIRFSLLDKQLLTLVIFVVFIFDGFSQLAGQLFGKKKFMPKISPNKTVEGLIGGFIMSIISAVLIFMLMSKDISQAILIGFGISLFAFLGDLSSSYVKRRFEVKDYSQLIPGHGGFLDRFDSLIFGGSFLYLIGHFISI